MELAKEPIYNEYGQSGWSENQLAKAVIDCCFRIHKSLGPGLLESVYEECLFYELVREGFVVEKQRAIPVEYEEIKMDIGFRADLIVEGKLIVELKSVDAIADIHIARTLTYMRFTNCKLGLLINFNSVLLKNGIKRLILGKLNDE